MSTNYNNYIFSIFKMNIGILTITSTNKKSYLYMEKKIEKSETLSLPHGHTVAAVLQNRKNLSYKLT